MASCERCCYLSISKANEDHVTREHFNFEDINPLKSYFFVNKISPWELFDEVRHVPWRQMIQLGWHYGRFIYTMQFNFDVGIYPVRGLHRLQPTNRVRIVCALAECPGCGINAPTDIVTIYPWNDDWCARYGSYWGVPAERRQKLWGKIRLAGTPLNSR